MPPFLPGSPMDDIMSFSEIIGQSAAVLVLTRALAAGKLAHAYIFEGIEGCGKKKTALALARSIFCSGRDGCGTCPACRKVAALQHPDLHVLEPDGAFIKIDQIRALQKDLSYRPFEAEKKVAIVEAADRMNPAAANAFLKTLEEPPGNALLILLTANIEAILPTILSRCQRLSFSPIPVDTIEEYLRRAGAGDETARISASLAGGSLKKAVELSGEECFQERSRTVERVISLSGDDIASLFRLAEELGNNRDAALETCDLLTLFLRDLLLLQTSGQIPQSSLLQILEKLAVETTPERTIEKIDLVSRSQKGIQRNVNPRLALEVLFMGLSD